jgi:hypothetical protein
MIDLEVKEFGAEPDPCSRDILGMKHQVTMNKGKNMHGARTILTARVKSSINGWVKVRYMGIHLLQFEKTNPTDSAWIKWDKREITEQQLIGLLLLELDPFNPDRKIDDLLRDRHARDMQPYLFDFSKQAEC